ncbi:MAG: ABC transporter permease [Chloroflexi bacterium]|nr:ABC transporter permease [Chloroflexota bacterium]
MRQYLIRRLLLFIPLLVGVSLIIFAILRIIPGDVAMVILGAGGEGQITEEALNALREELGLNRPLHVQYLTWAIGILRLDAGNSLYTGKPVFEEIARRFPLTLELASLTVVVSLLIAIPVGVVSALRQDTWVDYIFRVVTVGGIAMPTFWTGTLIILFMVLWFHWMPPLGFAGLFDDPSKNLQQLIWPAMAMGYFQSAVVGRMTRSCTLEVLRQDYIRTAWSKGLRERVVVIRHALKNALLPIVTLIGIEVATLLGGTVVMETVFVLPGMGSNLVDSIYRRDYPMIQTIIVLFSFVVAVVNLMVDIVYGWLDPRIRYT